MAKKMNSLAGDFEGISKAADSKVLELLHEKQYPATIEKANKSDPEKVLEPKTNSQPKKDKESQTGKAKPKSSKPRQLEDWGRPIAHFNTRIPEPMSQLLDDLIDKLRKSGISKSKQDLAREALHDLLRKHSIC